MVISADENVSRRFTRIFLIILATGLAVSAGLALYVDPLATFGTGRLPPLLTNEREDKPKAFLRLDPSPQAIVVGSSRVMKLAPSCITELTGLPAFNFGFSNARVEDWDAVVAFYRDRSHAQLQELIIGVDVESFDNTETDRRLLSSTYFSSYLGGDSHISWDTASRALFSMQALSSSMTSIRRYLRTGTALHYTTGPDGFLTYPDWEEAVREGTFKQEPHIVELASRLQQEAVNNDFRKLSPSRVARFINLVKWAHAARVTVDVFIPPLHPAIVTAQAKGGQLVARTQELNTILLDLERDGLIRYLKVDKVEDFGGDLAGYFDGGHMMESNTSRLLLKMFHHSRGCGLT